MPRFFEPSYVLAAGIVFIILCPIVTILRFITRLRTSQKSSLGIDDWLTIPATVSEVTVCLFLAADAEEVFTIGCGIILIIGNVSAFSFACACINDPQVCKSKCLRIPHLFQIPTVVTSVAYKRFACNFCLCAYVSSAHVSLQLEYSFLLLQTLGIGCTKLSFIFFYRRIFCVGSWKSRFGIASGIIGICVLCWIIAFFFWIAFACPTDPAGRWESPKKYIQVCTSANESAVGLAISDFITDFAIVVLPIVPVCEYS